MLPSAEQLFKYADFIFQQDLAPAHTAKSTKSWFNDHGVSVLEWPVNSPDQNPIEQGCQTQCPQACSSPPHHFMWPARAHDCL